MRKCGRAAVSRAIVIGRDTPAVSNDGGEIRRLTARHPTELVGVGWLGSIRPASAQNTRSKRPERALRSLRLAAINVEPALWRSAEEAFDNSLYLGLCEALQDLGAPLPDVGADHAPDLAFNDPSAISRVPRAPFPACRSSSITAPGRASMR